MKQYLDNIGKKANLDIGGLGITVVITDVKQVYGTVRYFVNPVKGNGAAWVNADRLFIFVENVT